MIWLRYSVAVFLLLVVIQVDTIVAEVIGSSVSGVDHVGSLDQIKGCGGNGLGPDHFCVLVVVM